jgi:hypothetical protein
MSTVYKSGSIEIADYPKDRIEFEWRGLQCFLIGCSGDKSTWTYNEKIESYELQDINFQFVVIVNGSRWEIDDIELDMHDMYLDKEEVLDIVCEHLDDNQMELCTNP